MFLDINTLRPQTAHGFTASDNHYYVLTRLYSAISAFFFLTREGKTSEHISKMVESSVIRGSKHLPSQ